MRQVSSVLFVCGMNAIRSPMAESIARSLLPRTYVVSAGVHKGERDPFVDVVLREMNLSPCERAPQLVTDLADGFFDLIVTLAPEADEAARRAAAGSAVEIEFWPMPDPSLVTGSREQILGAYRDVAAKLQTRIRERLAAA